MRIHVDPLKYFFNQFHVNILGQSTQFKFSMINVHTIFMIFFQPSFTHNYALCTVVYNCQSVKRKHTLTRCKFLHRLAANRPLQNDPLQNQTDPLQIKCCSMTRNKISVKLPSAKSHTDPLQIETYTCCKFTVAK